MKVVVVESPQSIVMLVGLPPFCNLQNGPFYLATYKVLTKWGFWLQILQIGREAANFAVDLSVR